MNSFIHRAKDIFKKQLLTLVLACAMLISAAPLQAMALEEQPEQAAEIPVTVNPADTQTDAGNWGFESGDLRGWTVLTPGWGTNEQGKSAGVVSAVSEGECEMPTNQGGSYHLSGLHNGVPGVEGWAVRSSTFVLGGSGWISVKMGGEAAAVKVFLSDGTQVGYYRQSRYKNVNYPYLSQGGAWNDMATYAIDLSKYLGKEMYLVLCDEVVGSSAYAVFDDVVTNYDAAPDVASRFDTVIDGHKKGDTASEVRIPWVKASNSYKPCTENNVTNGGFESGDLTGWTVLTEGFDASSAVVNERTYWAQELPYNQSGSFHLNGWNTGISEEKGWAVRSSTFVLGGCGYISVKMGGNAAVAKVFLTDGTQVGYYRNFRFHDTNFPYISKGGAWCDMATYVIDLSDYLGKEMYIELHDEVITDGWANAFFDDVVTYYETAPDASKHSDKAPDGHNSGEMAKLTYIPWVSVPKTSTEYANQIPNGDFETGDLSGWTVFGSGFPIKNGLPAADSATTYWDQELPFNKSGNYFINGSALSGNEASTWRLRSTPFTLAGSGWISVKMGGHAAAVRVYKLDGTLVGDFDQSRFCDINFPYLSKDGSWNDMATYLLDLTQNIGDVLYIELCDDPVTGGWANAFFDDVVTYYEKAPVANKYDTVKDGHQPGEKPKTVKIPTVVGMNNLYSPRNGGFEMGNLTGWTLVKGVIKPNTAVLAVGKSYNIDDENIPEWRTLPYNISGNFIITGHDATWEESDTWTLRSTPFTLAGSGYISVKMGGRTAAFQVRTVKDNKIVAYCEQRRFNDSYFPYISKGGSWRDMAVYVMDLSQFLGEKLVIELMDEEDNGDGGWKDAYFDDVIAYYPKRPTTKADTVIDGYKIGYDEPKEIEIPWIYLDGHEYEMGNRFPLPAPSMGGISGTVTPSDPGDPDAATIVNLYDYFKSQQGLNDYQLDASKLTFTKVMYFDSDGKGTSLICDYSKLKIKEGCYVVEYKFEQGGVTQTGKFDLVALPDEPSNTIFNGGFETGSLAGWTVEGDAFGNSGVVSTDQRYWEDRAVYGWGKYCFDGASKEGETGSMRSAKFILGGDGYISFMMGAGGNNAYVALCDGDTDEELIKVTNEGFNDPLLALTLLRVYMDASEYKGRTVYLKAVDDATGGFGFLCLDDFRVSLTSDEVRDLAEEQLEKIKSETYTSAKYDDLTNLRNYYDNYSYPVAPRVLTITKYAGNQVVDCGTVDLTAFIGGVAAKYGDEPVNDVKITKVTFNGTEITSGFNAFDMSAPGYYHVTYTATHDGRTAEATFTVVAMADRKSVANGGFEAGNLAGWTVLTDGWSVVDGQPAGVISATSYWGENLPYNQAGDYHLDGWNTGLDESKTWTVKSSNFTLAGSGFISVRMGGHAAAVHVYLADDTEVGYYKQTRFNDANFPSVGAGGSWADMGTYVMDLSAYKGQEMYIVLADEQATGWANAFFDEVVTYYETAPAYENLSDTVADGGTGDPVEIPWQLAENLCKPEESVVFEFTNKPANEALKVTEIETQKAVDLKAMLADVGATYNDEPAKEVIISRVEFHGSKIAALSEPDYTAYDMSELGVYEVFYKAVLDEKVSQEMSFIIETYDECRFPNGGFELGDLTGWTPVSCSFGDHNPVISDESYWDEGLPYNQKGNYHLDGFPANTGIEEGDSWAIRSDTFKLGGSGYISVRIGGNAAAVEVYTADNTLVGRYRQTRFNDINFPFVGKGGSWADMGTYVIDLKEYKDKEMYIVLLDEGSGPWANAFFDEVVTYYETAPDWETLSDPVTDGNNSGTAYIPWQLARKVGDPSPAQVTNGGFESGDLRGWRVLTPGFNAGSAVISAETYWGENLPYNQAGAYHLDGWNTDIGEGDSWAIRSDTFKLDGSGYISVRMGGHAAAVKVFKSDGTLVGYYKQTRFNDDNFPSVGAGGSWADMGTYVMDLSKYIGQELYIELHDEAIDGGWAHAFFDEVVTYYETAPDYENGSDTVADGGTGDSVQIPWQLAWNELDGSRPAAAMLELDEVVPKKSAEAEAPNETEEPDETEQTTDTENPAEPEEQDVTEETEDESEEESEPEDPDDESIVNV